MRGRANVGWLALALAVITVAAAPEPAHANEPWLLDLEASGGAPVTDPQRDWYGAGGSLAIGVGRPLASWLALEARLRSALFLDGEQPDTAGVRDHGNATLNVASLGVHLRIPDGSPRRATGAWLSAALGGGFTGKELRATWEAGIGYGFAVTQTVALGPVLRFIQVIQPDDQLSPRDARLLLGGVRLSLFDAAPEKKPPPTRSDRDGDGIDDERDGCPDAPEDRDGYQDDDGCPDADNDGDGLLDASDGCPDVAEDKDGFEDEDGCPDSDNDKDGFADKDDQCPLEPETVNGERDDDGCPDEGLIVMRDDRVVLEERVLFDLNSPRVKHSGIPILRAIVKLKAQHPEWTKMRIEGHADARGDAAFNQQLSERRAHNAREALIELGMDPESLIAEGFGSSRLLTTDTTDEAHSKNRRVEFVMISQVGEPASTPEASSGPASGGDAKDPPEQPSAPPQQSQRAGGKEPKR